MCLQKPSFLCSSSSQHELHHTTSCALMHDLLAQGAHNANDVIQDGVERYTNDEQQNRSLL